MNLALRKPMTLAEFLEWEERQPLRYEFDGVGPVAMAGGSVRHAQIQRNFAFALTARLRGKPCQFLGSDLKIQTEEDHARYPDGIVICSPLTGSETIVDAPVVIFEVLSPSTTHTDRFVKAREYQRMPSVQRYVMLEQDSINAVVYAARAMHGRTKSWSPTQFSPCLRSRSSSPLRNSTKASSSRRKTSPISLPNPSPLNLLLAASSCAFAGAPEASAGDVRPPSPIFCRP